MSIKNEKSVLNVAVSAAGSPLGQSIFKALDKSTLNLNIHLTDISDFAAGFFLNKNENNHVLPLMSSSEYKKVFFEFLTKHEISVYFPTISPDHKFLWENSAEIEALGVKVAGINHETYELCNDKYQCFEKLKASGVNIPNTLLISKETEIAENQFPIIMKPRTGASSADLFKVKDQQRYHSIKRTFGEDYFIGQEYMSAADEYTIGVYRSKNEAIEKSFIIKRELKFGLSYRGEIIESEELSQYAIEVCRALGTDFSANVQLKIHKGKPCVFEVNPRLSSTTCIRANFGFNEPELMIRELMGWLDGFKWNLSKGRFMRYWEEIYLTL